MSDQFKYYGILNLPKMFFFIILRSNFKFCMEKLLLSPHEKSMIKWNNLGKQQIYFRK